MRNIEPPRQVCLRRRAVGKSFQRVAPLVCSNDDALHLVEAHLVAAAVAGRGQGLEIDHKEIARRNTQALERDKFDYHLSTPLLATPGEALGESIDLIDREKRVQLSSICSFH